jgi:two-component system, LytTR family, sensor kinase
MNKNKKNIRTHTIIEKIATFDFDKYYTPTVRLMCHLAMWILFTFFIQINLLFDYKLPFTVTLLFAGRSLLCNMAVFYLFFYLIVPHTLLKNRVVLAILSLPLCLVLWIILNHYYLLVLGENLMSSNPYLKVVNENQRETFAQVISFKSILVNIIVVFYSISSFFFIKIVFDIIRFYSKWFKSERKSVQLELDKLNLERDFLKAQLNPHFLFNTLNNLYGLSLISDHRTPNAIAQLSQMMRYTLYESNAELVPLTKELEFLENYVMLEKMRYKENKNIVFNLNKSNIDVQMIAPLLTFTFVENGFKYGLKPKNEGFLKIDVSIKNNVFHFSILNDKEENVEQKEYSGIGTVNIRKRLKLLYPAKHELKIEDRGKSFFVEMKIKL